MLVPPHRRVSLELRLYLKRNVIPIVLKTVRCADLTILLVGCPDLVSLVSPSDANAGSLCAHDLAVFRLRPHAPLRNPRELIVNDRDVSPKNPRLRMS